MVRGGVGVIGGPSWLTLTAWQGGELHVDHLVPLGDGSYRTTGPMPLTGEWKTLVLTLGWGVSRVARAAAGMTRE